jgi:3-phosphoshikimate 1-carboxyvinyltransferase
MSADFIDLPQLLLGAGRVRLPGSKSISNRVLLLAALASGRTELRDLLASDDTARMLDALRTLGVGIEPAGRRCCSFSGVAGACCRFVMADLFLGNAGTAFRPLTAVLALAGGTTGWPACRACTNDRSPISSMACGSWAPTSDYLGVEGFPPLADSSTAQAARCRRSACAATCRASS